MYETQEVLLNTENIQVRSYPKVYSDVFGVIEDHVDGEKVIIYEADLLHLAALLNNAIAERTKRHAAAADNCRDCDENNSGVTL